jgi:hypothetical protein
LPKQRIAAWLRCLRTIRNSLPGWRVNRGLYASKRLRNTGSALTSREGRPPRMGATQHKPSCESGLVEMVRSETNNPLHTDARKRASPLRARVSATREPSTWEIEHGSENCRPSRKRNILALDVAKCGNDASH